MKAKQKAVEYLRKNWKSITYRKGWMEGLIIDAIDIALKTQKEEYEKRIKELKEECHPCIVESANKNQGIVKLSQENTKLQKEIDELKKFIKIMEDDTYIRMSPEMLKDFKLYIKAKLKKVQK